MKSPEAKTYCAAVTRLPTTTKRAGFESNVRGVLKHKPSDSRLPPPVRLTFLFVGRFTNTAARELEIYKNQTSRSSHRVNENGESARPLINVVGYLRTDIAQNRFIPPNRVRRKYYYVTTRKSDIRRSIAET